MYRFLIIDDEPVVREGIATTINWHAHGFELVGVCRDGREGLQALEELRPDVVMTDICMPFVDGLELAAAVAEQYPATKTILLTGYDEFEYAQEAVRLNVRDFILKPVTAAELRDILDSLHRELEEERNHTRNLQRLHEQVRESVPLLRGQFLTSLVHDPPSLREITERAALLDLDLPGPVFVTLLCDRDDRDDRDHTHTTTSLDGLAVQREIIRAADALPGAVTFTIPRDAVGILLSLEDFPGAIPRALECAERISDEVQRALGRTVSIGIGDAVRDLSELPESFRSARLALEQRFVLGSGQVITMDQVRGEQPRSVTEPSPRGASHGTDAAERHGLAHALKTGARNEAIEALNRIFRLAEHTSSVEQCQVLMHRVLADALNALDSIAVDYRQVPGVDHNPFDQLGRFKTVDEIETWLRSFVNGVCALLASRREQHSHRKGVDAVAYIHRHYMRSDLGLQDVCSALAVSKSYLSPIFKNHTGMTFVEYLTVVRMNEAKVLLAGTDLKIYEIAAQVGFRNAHYFSLTFRKQTGVSASDYREQSQEAAGA